MAGERRIIVIGAGMGGLSAGLRLRRAGHEVVILEASPAAGGLASSLELSGFGFDGGPYILLDRPGLEWAFGQLGIQLEERLHLRKIDSVYEVSIGTEHVRIHTDLEQTAAGMDNNWPGAGAKYRKFVREMAGIYDRLGPLQRASRPSLGALVRAGALRHLPFLLKSLGTVLRSTGLPRAVVEALGIWTHVANQDLDAAPSPLALVPALIHQVGAYYPVEGIASIPRLLAERALANGVEIRFGTKVQQIQVQHGRAAGVVTTQGETLEGAAVLSNAHGVGTYLDLLDETHLTASASRRLQRLPLQSPGVCAYLAVKGVRPPHYLRFRLDGRSDRRRTTGVAGDEARLPCRLFIAPSVVEPNLVQADGWWPARLMAPLDHESAEKWGATGQRACLERLIEEEWWREGLTDQRVLGTRVPTDWGRAHTLHRDSMNPVVTPRFMRQGRIAHRSPFVKGLYLAGSSTHPGQWISFCAISGILAADLLLEDWSR